LWLSRFDPEARSYAPGHLLAEHMVNRSEELGIHALDLGPGENDYKLAWAGAAYDVATLTAFPAGSIRLRTRAGLLAGRLRSELRAGR
jgi:CelD/BcsL family acetyltransferase involved in cellulose biosynthesis